MVFRRFCVVSCLILVMIPVGGHAFMKEGCGSGECRDCHTLTREEATTILSGWVDNVGSVVESPVKGLWLLNVEKGGQRAPVYLDYSKSYIVSGQVFQLSTRANITGMTKPPSPTTDVAAIPLEGAVVIGSASAGRRVIVFTDPDCHFCSKLHEEIKAVVKKDPGIAFHVKVFSRNRNPAVIRKALSVVCAKSAKLLEDAYAGKELPEPTCKTDVVEETARLSAELGLMGTPAMILPDGRIIRGYRDADTIIAELRSGKASGQGKGK